jgi:hypothetical protein
LKNGIFPRYAEISDPQIPTRCTRTRASPGPGAFGSAILVFTNCCGFSRRMAFLVGKNIIHHE